MLSVPATDANRVCKAWSSGADHIVVDLEDAVVPERKSTARNALPAVAGMLERRPDEPVMTIRVNRVGSAWFVDDLAVAAAIPLVSSIMVPKVESRRDLDVTDSVLCAVEASLGRPDPLAVYALIESAAGLCRVTEIAAASPRVVGLVLGYADMTLALGRRAREDGFSTGWVPVQSAIVAAARTAGVVAIDGPWLGVADDEEFREAVQLGADLGFDATWVIHPRQVGAVNELHCPVSADLDRAQRIRAALTDARAEGRGAAQLDGRMVDEALAKWADVTLAKAPQGGIRDADQTVTS